MPNCEDSRRRHGRVQRLDLGLRDAFEGGDCVSPDCGYRSITLTDACGNATTADQTIVISEPPRTPNLPTGFSPNNDSFNDFYLIENVGPN